MCSVFTVHPFLGDVTYVPVFPFFFEHISKLKIYSMQSFASNDAIAAVKFYLCISHSFSLPAFFSYKHKTYLRCFHSRLPSHWFMFMYTFVTLCHLAHSNTNRLLFIFVVVPVVVVKCKRNTQQKKNNKKTNKKISNVCSVERQFGAFIKLLVMRENMSIN